MTPYCIMLLLHCEMAQELTLPQPTSYADSRLWGSIEATATQAQSWHRGENVRLCSEKIKNTFLVKVVDSQWCGAPRLTLAGPLRVCSMSPRSTAKKEKPPRVSADRCCWARHTQEGCCCHTQMHETVNLSGLYEMLGREGGEGGATCVHAGMEVYTLGTAVSSWLPSRPVFKPTPCTGIQAASHAKKSECSGGFTLRLKRFLQAVTQLHRTPLLLKSTQGDIWHPDMQGIIVFTDAPWRCLVHVWGSLSRRTAAHVFPIRKVCGYLPDFAGLEKHS